MITAFLVFYFLPFAGPVLYAKSTHLIPLEWMFVSIRLLLIGIFIVKLAIAGFIYVWSVRHERVGRISEA